MDIYEKKPQYDINSGKLCWIERVRIGSRCDYTGTSLGGDYTDPEEMPYPSYVLDYGNEDPMFGCVGEELEFFEEHSLEAHEFLSGPYEISYESCLQLVKEAAEEGLDFASALRVSRIRTARKLLKEGTIKPENLRGYEE